LEKYVVKKECERSPLHYLPHSNCRKNKHNSDTGKIYAIGEIRLIANVRATEIPTIFPAYPPAAQPNTLTTQHFTIKKRLLAKNQAWQK